MPKKLQYKGYSCIINYDEESNVLYGRIKGIKDMVLFEIENVKDVKKDFMDIVDDYLDLCERYGKVPETPVCC